MMVVVWNRVASETVSSWERLVCSSEVTILHKVMREGLISRSIWSRELKDVWEESTCTVGGGLVDREQQVRKP